MNTLGRILIILIAFALVMGVTYVAVNTVSASGNVPAFQQRGEGLPRPEGARSPFPGGEGREGRGGISVLRLIFGFVRNIGIVALIVALVVWLKNYLEKQRRQAPHPVD